MRRHWRPGIGAILATMLLVAAPAAAQTMAADARVLLIDLSDEDARIVSLDFRDLALDFDLQDQCVNGGEEGARKIKECVACAIPQHSTRWISHRGSELHVFVLFMSQDDTQPKVTFVETKRRSRLATDFGTLFKLGQKLLVERAGPRLRCAAKVYALQHDRATLKVTAEMPVPPAPPAEAPRVRSAAMTLITGSPEHLFLSADLPIRRLNDVKFSDGTLEPTTTPTRFFIGLNYSIGDLDDDRPRSFGRTLRDNLVARVMFEASSTPFDSFGVALALRGSYLSSFGIDFDVVSPFVGYVWTRPEDTEIDELTGTVQFGFSFNLNKALSWVQD